VVEQPIDAVAHWQLPLLATPLQVSGAAAFTRARQPIAQLGDELLHALPVGLKRRVRGIDVRLECYHPQQSVL
jgi:hypothetical protein